MNILNPVDLTSVRGGIVAEVDCPIVVVVIEAAGGISRSGVSPPTPETVCMPQVGSPVQQSACLETIEKNLFR